MSRNTGARWHSTSLIIDSDPSRWSSFVFLTMLWIWSLELPQESSWGQIAAISGLPLYSIATIWSLLPSYYCHPRPSVVKLFWTQFEKRFKGGRDQKIGLFSARPSFKIVCKMHQIIELKWLEFHCIKYFDCNWLQGLLCVLNTMVIMAEHKNLLHEVSEHNGEVGRMWTLTILSSFGSSLSCLILY